MCTDDFNTKIDVFNQSKPMGKNVGVTLSETVLSVTLATSPDIQMQIMFVTLLTNILDSSCDHDGNRWSREFAHIGSFELQHHLGEKGVVSLWHGNVLYTASCGHIL